MRRFGAILLLMILLTAIPCTAAEKDWYAVYTPKSERSSVFYIDVYCERKITAAVFELSFDKDMVSYYSSSAISSSATVRDNPLDSAVKVAFADTDAVSGKICRLSFKALKTGSARFVLHMEQAAGADRTLIAGWSDDTLTVTFGKEDIAGTNAVTRSPGVSSGSSKSSMRQNDRSDPGALEGEQEPLPPGEYDMRRSSPLKWILIGAGIPVLIAALVLTGVIIGRKTKTAAQKKEPGEESPGTDEEKHFDE